MEEVGSEASERVKVRRMPERAQYDRAGINAILDEGLLAHVGMVTSHGPVVIPMLYARDGEMLYLHGSAASRLLREGRGVQLCVTVSIIDGLVVARSLAHHSMNYRSVVVMGEASPIENFAEKSRVLDVLSEHVIPGRVEATRPHLEKEIKGTLVLSMSIAEASAKVRTGPPIDEEEDYALDTWAGVLPLGISVGEPLPDPRLAAGIEAPRHITSWQR
jgi:nitroimidazol reductase NimA-like FMN-containing flavoprotein (pyridoxamine 5'-phosphate oxidase superfamily)